MTTPPHSRPSLKPSPRREGMSWSSWVLAVILTVLLAEQFEAVAQDTNSVSQTNEMVQAEETTADSAQTADAAQDESSNGTNAVSGTNQTTAAGPDGRTRRQRRRAQSRPGDPGSNRAPSSSTADLSSAGSSLDYSAFRLVATRNIFDPNRAPRTSRAPSQPAKTTESFTLVGTLSYEKGSFAFFDGTSSDYKKAVKTNDSIAGYTIAAISNDSVKLEQNTNVVQLAVGTQMRRQDDGSWAQLAVSEPVTVTSSSSTTSSTPSAADNDILMKLKMRREKE